MLSNIDVYLHMIAVSIVLLFTVFYSLLIIVVPNIYTLIKLFSVVVLIATIYIGINRNTYLPFLGYAAVPPSIFAQEISPHNANVSYTLNVGANIEDGTHVLYWGALHTNSDEPKPDPISAYGNYSNTGITTVKNNKALLHFHCPDKYNVSGFKTLERHIHYRLIRPNDPMMSPVYTAYVIC